MVGLAVLRSLNVTQSESQPSVSDTEKSATGREADDSDKVRLSTAKEGSGPYTVAVVLPTESDPKVRDILTGRWKRCVIGCPDALSARTGVGLCEIDELGPGSTTVAAVYHFRARR